MILNFTRGALMSKKPRKTISSNENDKYNFLIGTNRSLTETQKAQQLIGDEKTRLTIIWTTIFLMVLGLTLAAFLFG